MEMERDNAARRLDERAAREVMHWVPGGPDQEYWVLPHAPAGLSSVIRMAMWRWRPTEDAFCLSLLLHELRELGLAVGLDQRCVEGATLYSCTVGAVGGVPASVEATAPTPGLAVVCAALSYGESESQG